MSRILICSTDVFPRKALVRALTEAGIAQDIVETDSIDEVSDASDVSALILDEPSSEQCRRASEIAPRVPVFILSDLPRTDEEAVVFVKPFGPSAFIGALIGAVSRFEQSDDAAVFIGRAKFNPHKKTLTFEQETVTLTDKESALLDLLRRADAPVPKETLLRDVWGYNDAVATHTLETHIYRLRQKLENTGLSFVADAEEGYRLIIEGKSS